MIEHEGPEPPDSSVSISLDICDNTLDDAQLRRRCPLDNRRHDNFRTPRQRSAGQLDELPAELLVQVLSYVDIPSLTHFRRVNRRAVDLVSSIPQYKAIYQHCPDILRAMISIQADAFSCERLYEVLCSTRCSTCEHFGSYLYLIDCRRVCWFCFTERPEFLPLTIGRASECYRLDPARSDGAVSGRKLLSTANPPSVLSLPGRYSCGLHDGVLVRKRLKLFDRRAVVRDTMSHEPSEEKHHSKREAGRYMAIITAPYLFDAGRRADWGYFCLGCREAEEEEKSMFFRIKYTRQGISAHLKKYGPVVRDPETYYDFMHAIVP